MDILSVSDIPMPSRRFSFSPWTGNYQEGLCPVRLQGKYFHLNREGERMYPETYRYVGDFKDGVACVRTQKGLFRHIKSDVLPLNGNEYLDLRVFHNGYATAKDAKGWFHIDQDGYPLYKERYVIVEPFYNGFALVEDKKGKKSIIDVKGERVHFT